ncbi:hypothetical protein CANCADRAFT_25374 [Tortispora caseinolytica NRRL Y-17796]|uniref:Pirin n=1 Tax=Tortispora caseinolytica NRRL Y-17796 TaxID=767744 RepID=A0A1E4TDM3_9ASCO|nr:hypothetical protein CANCADRAFT_25374 [Tortispora caseinolytica NRRL Y-17796]
MRSRIIDKVFLAAEQAEGVGARVRRSIGSRSARNFSPFLMLDHFSVSPKAGFPDHPHRGMETITYVLEGQIQHEDFTGSKGTLNPGDLQFMTAGKGIVHAEMPVPDSDKNIVGMQLWVDLPLRLKNTAPRYRDLHSGEIPCNKDPDTAAIVRVISGQSHGVDSIRELSYTTVWYLDFTLRPGANIEQLLPEGYNAFVYVLEGEAVVGGTSVAQYNCALLTNKPGENGITLSVPDIEEVDSSEHQKETRLILVAGEILDQPIVQYGPFVVTSMEEVQQAFLDYQTGRNGFEKSVGWQSEIGQRLM